MCRVLPSGIVLEPEFMGLAFAVALAAMLLVECGRYNGLPAAPAVDRFMRRFTDERESGPGRGPPDPTLRDAMADRPRSEQVVGAQT